MWRAGGLFLASLALAGQTPKFSARSSAVVVDVIVTDSKGNAITGLTADDFKVLENDAPQKITGFETPDPASPQKPKYRFVTLAMDVGDMRSTGLKATVDAAKEYVEKVLQPGDFAGLYSIGSKMRLVVPFTKDKGKLIEGIQSLSEHPNDGAYTAKDRDRTQTELNRLREQEAALESSDPSMAEMVRTERLTLQGSLFLETTFQARAVFVALRSIAQSVATLPGRKNVVLFSEGFTHSPEAAAELSAVVDAANRANVAVYVVDPAGLNSVGLSSGTKAESAGTRRAGRSARIAMDSDADQFDEVRRQGSKVYGGYSAFDLIQRIGSGVTYDDLETVADSTGGFFIRDQNSLTEALKRIDRDLREYYTLTYQTQNQNFDGAFRKIHVSLANHGGKLRYRKGYWAIAPGEEMSLTPAAAQLFAAARSGSLKATLPSRMNASVLLDAEDKFALPVSFWVKGDASALVKSGDGFSSGVTFVVVARDEHGALVDVAQRTLSLNFTKDGAKEFEKEGLKLTAMLRAPKMESLNAQAVVQFSNGVAGSGKFHVKFAEEETGARPTSLLLTQRVDAAKKDEAPNALGVGGYKLVQPTQNVFRSGDKLTLYFGLEDVAFDKGSGNPNLKLEVVMKSGSKVVKTLPANALYPFPDSGKRVFFLGQFELAGLTPGDYTIEASVEDKAKNTRSLRTAGFSILE